MIKPVRPPLSSALSASPTSQASTSSGVRLRVQGAEGHSHTVDFSGMSEADATRKAAARGLRVLAVESLPGAHASSAALSGARVAASAAKAPFPLLLFSQELLALLEAGLNLMEALATLQAKERQLATRAVLEDLLRLLREGKNYSDALAVYPQHFPAVYVATIRASERTGDLPQALERFIGYQLQFDTIKKKLVSTAIYPAMLLVVGGFVTLFLLGYVVPRFSVVYQSSGREMPWLSTMLLAFGRFIDQYWPFVLATLMVLVALMTSLMVRPAGRAMVLGQVLRFPWLAGKADEFRLSRFYRAVSLLLASGIALPRALGMVDGLLGASQQARLVQGRLAVEQGQSLSTALMGANLASPVAESLIKVGERSGQLAEMLERTARFHDEELSRWLDWASRLLEPILMTVIGLVIGTVVVLMYMPILDLAGSLQ